MDLGIEFAACHELDAFAEVFGGAALGAHKCQFLEDEGVGEDCGGVGGHAHEDDLAVLLDSVEGVCGGLASAGEVDNEIKVLIGEFSDAGLHFFGTEAERELLGGGLSGRDVDFAAFDGSDTDGKLAQAADADDADFHAGLGAADCADGVVRGGARISCSGCLFRSESGGDFDQLFDGGGRHGAVTAVSCVAGGGAVFGVERADCDDVADFIAFDAFADLDDAAADFVAHDDRYVKAAHPGFDVQRGDVGVAEAAGQSLEYHVSRLCFRVRLFDDFKRLMCSCEFPSFHCSFFLSCVLRLDGVIFWQIRTNLFVATNIVAYVGTCEQ